MFNKSTLMAGALVLATAFGTQPATALTVFPKVAVDNQITKVQSAQFVLDPSFSNGWTLLANASVSASVRLAMDTHYRP